MFAAETEKLVEQLIQAEYKNACERYGEKYLCIAQMFDVLSEEVKEVFDELRLAEIEVVETKFLTKSYNTETLLKLENYARNAIKELAQVGAVLKKIKNTFDEVEE